MFHSRWGALLRCLGSRPEGRSYVVIGRGLRAASTIHLYLVRQCVGFVVLGMVRRPIALVFWAFWFATLWVSVWKSKKGWRGGVISNTVSAPQRF